MLRAHGVQADGRVRAAPNSWLAVLAVLLPRFGYVGMAFPSSKESFLGLLSVPLKAWSLGTCQDPSYKEFYPDQSTCAIVAGRAGKSAGERIKRAFLSLVAVVV